MFDRILFTLCFICGLQVPAFVEAYRQRLSGHFDEATLQLEQYQTVANMHFQGDINQLIESFKANQEQAVVHSADIIESLLLRVDYLTKQLNGLNQEQYFNQLVHLVTNIDTQIASQTVKDYTLNIPLTVEAASTGFFIALLPALLFGLLKALTRLVVQDKKRKTFN